MAVVSGIPYSRSLERGELLMRHVVLVLGTGLLGLASACGGASSPGASPGAAADAGSHAEYFHATAVKTACQTLAQDRCDKRDACTNGMDSRLQYATAADCVTRAEANCIVSLGAPGTGSTPERVTACANE